MEARLTAINPCGAAVARSVQPHHLSANDDDELVVVRDARVHSLCAPHMLPFIGVAHGAHLPGDRTAPGLAQVDGEGHAGPPYRRTANVHGWTMVTVTALVLVDIALRWFGYDNAAHITGASPS